MSDNKYKGVVEKAKKDIDFISQKNIKTAKERGESLIDETLLNDFHIKVMGSMDNILKKKNEFGDVVVAIHSDILVDFFCDRNVVKEKLEKINSGIKEEKFNETFEERQKIEEEERKLEIAKIKEGLDEEQSKRLEKIKQLKGGV